MKKILFLIISVLMVFGCSKENEEVVGHNKMSYENFVINISWIFS